MVYQWYINKRCTGDLPSDLPSPGLSMRIGIYVEDSGDNNDGALASIRVLKLADASAGTAHIKRHNETSVVG